MQYFLAFRILETHIVLFMLESRFGAYDTRQQNLAILVQFVFSYLFIQMKEDSGDTEFKFGKYVLCCLLILLPSQETFKFHKELFVGNFIFGSFNIKLKIRFVLFFYFLICLRNKPLDFSIFCRLPSGNARRGQMT